MENARCFCPEPYVSRNLRVFPQTGNDSWLSRVSPLLYYYVRPSLTRITLKLIEREDRDCSRPIDYTIISSACCVSTIFSMFFGLSLISFSSHFTTKSIVIYFSIIYNNMKRTLNYFNIMYAWMGVRFDFHALQDLINMLPHSSNYVKHIEFKLLARAHMKNYINIIERK